MICCLHSFTLSISIIWFSRDPFLMFSKVFCFSPPATTNTRSSSTYILFHRTIFFSFFSSSSPPPPPPPPAGTANRSCSSRSWSTSQSLPSRRRRRWCVKTRAFKRRTSSRWEHLPQDFDRPAERCDVGSWNSTCPILFKSWFIQTYELKFPAGRFSEILRTWSS